MLEAFLQDYLIFLAKSITLVLVVLAVATIVISAVRQLNASRTHERLDTHNLNDRYQDLSDTLREALATDPELKKLHKERKAQDKARHRGSPGTRKPCVYVMNFKGDLHAHAVDELREEVSTVLQVAADGDEVLLRLESEGGLVHAYGLAASQLARFRARGIPLTVAIDKVAASGGYLMACVATHIIAAPFAVVGSIGVIAQLPNFNRLLRRFDVDYELHTAGEFKRTLTLFGENNEATRAKFREELEETHLLFKRFVAEHRPQLDLVRVATGEHWFGSQALDLHLVDALQTSDDYLLQRVDQANLVELRFHRHKSLSERFSHGLVRLGHGLRHGLQDSAGARWR